MVLFSKSYQQISGQSSQKPNHEALSSETKWVTQAFTCSSQQQHEPAKSTTQNHEQVKVQKGKLQGHHRVGGILALVLKNRTGSTRSSLAHHIPDTWEQGQAQSDALPSQETRREKQCSCHL